MEFTPPKYLYAEKLYLLVLEKKGKGLLVALVGDFGFVFFIVWLGFYFFIRYGEALKPFFEYSFNLHDKQTSIFVVLISG